MLRSILGAAMLRTVPEGLPCEMDSDGLFVGGCCVEKDSEVLQYWEGF